MSKNHQKDEQKAPAVPEQYAINLNILGAVISTLIGAITFFKDIVEWSLSTKLIWIALLVVSLIVFSIFSRRSKLFRKTSAFILKKKLDDEKIQIPPRHSFDLIQFIQWGLGGALSLIILSIIFESLDNSVIKWIATKTPTPYATVPPTQTFTPTDTTTNTATATFTPTFTPTPVSAKSRYYMIVLDASRNMNVPFGDGTQTKWDAALASVRDMLKALNDYANFGLVVVGGQDEDVVVNPCDAPQVPLVPFVSPEGNLLPNTRFPKQGVITQLDQLRPSGGGAFDEAFIVAKNQLENLPPNTIKMLLYITGASDTCESEDEWDKLTRIMKITNDLASYREIIVLTEKIEPEVQAFADYVNQLSANTNVQAPQNQQELDQSLNIALEQVEVQAQEQARALVSAQPAPLSPYTPTAMRTATGPPTPGAWPTSATPIPVATKTKTPLPPPPATNAPPSVELIFNGYANSGIGCHINVTVRVTGGTVTGSIHVWNAFYADPAGSVYPSVSYGIGDTPNYDITLGGDQPVYYSHNVWFEFGGGSSNVLAGLQCPGVP